MILFWQSLVRPVDILLGTPKQSYVERYGIIVEFKKLIKSFIDDTLLTLIDLVVDPNITLLKAFKK